MSPVNPVNMVAPSVAILLMAAVVCWPGRAALRTRSTRRLLTAPRPAQNTGSADDAGVAGSAMRRRLARLRRRDRGAEQLTRAAVLALLEGLAPALRAGLAPAEALTLLIRVNLDEAPGRPVTAWQSELAEVGARARDGEPLAPVWRGLAQAHRSPELMLLAQAWALSERLGSSLSEAVVTTTELVRERVRAGRRVDAATAGARATMNLLTLLPLGGGVVAALLGISPLELYARSPLAVACLVAGAGLLCLGRWMVRRMVRRSLRPEPPS